jgi:hypothetical protein
MRTGSMITNDTFRGMWNVAAMTYFNVLFRNLPLETGNEENRWSGYLNFHWKLIRARYEARIPVTIMGEIVPDVTSSESNILST